MVCEDTKHGWRANLAQVTNLRQPLCLVYNCASEGPTHGYINLGFIGNTPLYLIKFSPLYADDLHE